NLCCDLRALVPYHWVPSYRSLPHVLPARGRGRRSHLDSGHCGQVSPQTFFVAFSCRSSIVTVGNGPKVIEHNDPSLHQFQLRGGRVAESFVRAKEKSFCCGGSKYSARRTTRAATPRVGPALPRAKR